MFRFLITLLGLTRKKNSGIDPVIYKITVQALKDAEKTSSRSGNGFSLRRLQRMTQNKVSPQILVLVAKEEGYVLRSGRFYKERVEDE